MGAESNVPFFHPAHKHFRFVFLAMLCFMTFGSYWCYDIPDAIQNQLMAKFDLKPAHYAYFYSVYNFMNIGIVLFGGYFIDVIGLRIGAILFCFLITLGQIVFSFGSSLADHNTAYYVMLAGRVIFSLGGESLSVAQSTFAAKWFKGNELALAFGITLSFSRIGSFANLNVFIFPYPLYLLMKCTDNTFFGQPFWCYNSNMDRYNHVPCISGSHSACVSFG